MPTRRKMAALYKVPLSVIHGAITDDLRREVANDLGLIVGLEQGAAEFRTWESVVMPGLLQTEAYARVVQALGPTPVPTDELERRVALRMKRQAALDRLRMYALIDASVLTRPTGTPDVMADQLDHLRALTERPNVDIRVVSGELAHIGARGAFSLLTSPDAEVPFTVITEDAWDAHILGNALVVRAHLDLWDAMWRGSHGLDEVELQRT